MDDALEPFPHGLRVRGRIRTALAAAKPHGVAGFLQGLLLGPEHFRAFQLIGKVEPFLLRSPGASATRLERTFAECSDIYAHLPTLYRLTVEGPRPRILELGTRSGASTVALLLAAREIGGRVTSVDIEPCPEAKARVEAAGLSDLWTFVQADDMAFDWRQPIDHLFLDTSHEYAHTLAELRRYEPSVVEGGVLTLHDTTTWPAVWKAIEDHVRGRPDLRVFRYTHNNGLAIIEKGRPGALR